MQSGGMRIIKKYIMLSGILFFLLIVGFIGCLEQEELRISDMIEILNYNISTKKFNNGTSVIGEGFLHTDEADLYYVSGIVKNISDETLINVNVTAKFYNNANNFLTEKTTHVGGIPPKSTKDFGIYYFSNEDFFEDICGLKFEFEA